MRSLAVALAALAVVAATAGRAQARACPPAPPPPQERQLTRPQWLVGTIVTEYYPAPERWARGRLVAAPGLRGRHRVDWLYGASGLPMEGEGIGLDGRLYHFAGPWSAPWVNAAGARTAPCASGDWTGGRPAWLDVGWRNASGAVTFPLAGGGWSNGLPARTVRAVDPVFAAGRSRPLRYWRDAAVDPHLVPFGSRIFIRAYCSTPARGWLVAADTGGAIIGRHVDVYRAPPASPADARLLRGQAVFVVPPGTRPRRLPRC